MLHFPDMISIYHLFNRPKNNFSPSIDQSGVLLFVLTIPILFALNSGHSISRISSANILTIPIFLHSTRLSLTTVSHSS